ncbi:MAG: 4-carboxymuconolactone decarboxylase [Solirubrobacterales bacterium]|nr:4-carboxymuconolactone decarboxylase [Solirubrobacterales bacterium]
MEPLSAPPAPRIAPGTRAEIGRVNHAIARALGLVAGGGPPHVFTTLGRHPVFRRWLRFAGGLMPGGTLRRDETELLILRVGHNCDCAYELQQHERIALTAGLSREQIARVAAGPDAPGWTPRQAAFLRAADALHATRDLDDGVWSALRAELTDEQLIELCLVVGHYEMLAMTLNALRVQLDPLPDAGGSRGLRVVQRLVARRR